MSAPHTTTVAIANGQHVVASCLKVYLETCADLSVVGVAPSGAALLKHVNEWAPEVVLLDLPMPAVIDGTELIGRILAHLPSARIIVFAPASDVPMLSVLRAGAVGCIRADAEPEMLLAAIRAVASGKAYIDPVIAREMARTADPAADLTTHELDVLWHVALGRSSEDISNTLGLTPETIRLDLGHILAKLLVEERASRALVQTLKRNLGSPPSEERVN